MALTATEILGNPILHEVVKLQSRGLIDMFESDARLAAVFATQQRWLMSHAGLALYFRATGNDNRSGLNLTAFLDTVQRHGIASRNTADAYIKEMLKYHYIAILPSPNDRRAKPLEPSRAVVGALCGWMRVHLRSLDRLTGGQRLAKFDDNPRLIALMQPPVADGLIVARTIRNPKQVFSLFTWLDNGGLIMDWLITSMSDAQDDAGRIAVGPVAIAEMAARLNLSHTHLSRKLREAEAMNAIGWSGKRGHSDMWVSQGFRSEYMEAQAVKLALIDQSCEAAFGRSRQDQGL